MDPSLGLLGVLLEPTTVIAKALEQVVFIGRRSFWEPRVLLVTGAGLLFDGLLSDVRASFDVEGKVIELLTGWRLEAHFLGRARACDKQVAPADLPRDPCPA